MERAEAAKRIRKALHELTGRHWSVSGHRGTAWGWLGITAPPKRQIAEFPGDGKPEAPRGKQGWGYIGEADRVVLGSILVAAGMELHRGQDEDPHRAHPQGHTISPDGREFAVLALEALAIRKGRPLERCWCSRVLIPPETGRCAECASAAVDGL